MEKFSMMINELQTFVNNKLAERNLLVEQLAHRQEEIDSHKKYLENLTKARWVLAEVAKLTQRKVSGIIESLVTMAIQSVYDNDFKFSISFDIKRNKSECVLGVKTDDEDPFIPKEEDGGGLLDVLSFALRIVLWSLQKKRTLPFFWLDEPFRGLGSLTPKAGEMMQRIAKDLCIQFIIITHDNQLSDIADRSWTVKHNGSWSVVTQDGEIVKQEKKFKKFVKL
jgi:DNA repair exonuclease SbcCD ATPase subunit